MTHNALPNLPEQPWTDAKYRLQNCGNKISLSVNKLAALGAEARKFIHDIREGYLSQIDVSDRLYQIAEAYGLYVEHGVDKVQALIADGLDYEAEVAPPPSQPITSAQDKEKQPKPKQPVGGQRIKIIPFDEIRLSTERRYLVKGLVPRVGLCVAWGPPKCGKSFWAFDLSMHIALGWLYRGRRVQSGAVVYGAFEGSHGFGARIEAFRQRFLNNNSEPVPFYLEPLTLNLVREHQQLIAAIKANLGKVVPAAVLLDTLNRSLQGSESSDEDMTDYIRAADAIREAFGCAVIIIHHCGIDGTRPRGHTSLTGAVDAQLAVRRDRAGNIEVKVEWMKDGPEGETIWSRLEPLKVGTDEDGEPIMSCVVVPVEIKAGTDTAEPHLTKNQRTMFSILHEAGERGLTTEAWNERTREAGIGTKRRADLTDIRSVLKAKGFIRQTATGWAVNHQSP